MNGIQTFVHVMRYKTPLSSLTLVLQMSSLKTIQF